MSKKFQRILIALLLIIIAVLLTILFKPNQETSGQGVVFEPNDAEQANIGTSLPSISIPGWTAIKLPSGTKEAEVSLHNPEGNAGYYDLSFTLKLADSGEVLFSTGLIEPGYKCSRVTLSRELSPGEYNGILSVQPYLQDEAQTPTNNAELEILLIVE